MHMEENDFLRLIQMTTEGFSEKKRDNVKLLIRVYLEVLKRCPHMAEAPPEEKKELITILREMDLI